MITVCIPVLKKYKELKRLVESLENGTVKPGIQKKQKRK